MVEDRHHQNYVLLQDYFNDIQSYIRAAHLVASANDMPCEERIRTLQGLYWLAKRVTDYAVKEIDGIEMAQWNIISKEARS